MVNDTQRLQIQKLRTDGFSYGKIADVLGISANTVKTYCKRHGLGGVATMAVKNLDDYRFCLCCGAKIKQVPGRKEKKFCSDRCRNKWWNNHLDEVKRKANYEFICPCCKKPFTAYGNKNRKYCSHKCYVEDRFGGARHD